jgi:serine/threonine-protein kinase
MVIGEKLGPYAIRQKLGEGGMGAVFLAYDTTLQRPVALKVMGEAGNNETSRRRLLQEARNAAALNHPNICTIHEVGDASGTSFIAMEYVEGHSLRDRLDQRGGLPSDEALRYAMLTADALAYAHEHGVVHRDLKAANVMISSDARLKVVDFGLARRDDTFVTEATTQLSVVPAGVPAGTPYAMAPEQVRGEGADPRTDVWALGVLLYEMATGARPFAAGTVPELFSAILKEPPRPWPSGAPMALRPVVDRCLEKDPARRYQNARDVQLVLDTLQQSGASSVWTAWRYRLTRPRWLATAAALVAIAVISAPFDIGGLRDWLTGGSPPIVLAVLPFENLTGDPDQEYLSDGLTEEMITQLGRVHPRRLKVVARSSAMVSRRHPDP